MICMRMKVIIDTESIYIYGAAVYQWCGFKSCRGKKKKLTGLKSNSNTVWFNFQTYIYIYIYSSENELYLQFYQTKVQ
jgi:hypothetical protein